MSEPLWSVEFVIGDAEIAAIDYAGTRVLGPHSYMVVNPAADGSSPATIHIDVRAPNRDAAQPLAAERYRRIRQRAMPLGTPT